MASTDNVQVGPCSVVFNNVDLGHTKGGVTLSYEPQYHDVAVDKYGNTTVQKVLIGEKLSVKVPLAEFTIANLGVAIPIGAFAGAANARRTIGSIAGKRGSDYAYQLVLHPLIEGTRRHDVVISKAFVASTVELAHQVDGEKLIEVTFEALLDETKSDGAYLGFIGDSTK